MVRRWSNSRCSPSKGIAKVQMDLQEPTPKLARRCRAQTRRASITHRCRLVNTHHAGFGAQPHAVVRFNARAAAQRRRARLQTHGCHASRRSREGTLNSGAAAKVRYLAQSLRLVALNGANCVPRLRPLSPFSHRRDGFRGTLPRISYLPFAEQLCRRDPDDARIGGIGCPRCPSLPTCRPTPRAGRWAASCDRHGDRAPPSPRLRGVDCRRRSPTRIGIRQPDDASRTIGKPLERRIASAMDQALGDCRSDENRDMALRYRLDVEQRSMHRSVCDKCGPGTASQPNSLPFATKAWHGLRSSITREHCSSTSNTAVSLRRRATSIPKIAMSLACARPDASS
jgi:hypothetical protein